MSALKEIEIPPHTQLDISPTAIRYVVGSKAYDVKVTELFEKGDSHALILFASIVVAQDQTRRIGELAEALGGLVNAISARASAPPPSQEQIMSQAQAMIEKLMAGIKPKAE